MGNKRKSLRFGLMINSLTVEHWQYETIKLLMDNGMKLSLIIQKTENTTAPSFIKKIKDYPFRRLFFRLWNRFLFKPRSKFPADLTELTTDIHTIFCKPKIKGISTYFEEVDIQEIRNQNLDFILRFGFDIVRGEVLNAAKYGVWSFHHDDERIIRGGPPGFWEFMKKIPSNGVILQRLTNSLDKGIILKRIQFKTILHSYKAHLDQLYFGGKVLPLQVCKELIDNGVLEESPSESDAPIVYPPTNLKMIQYYWKLMWRRVGFHLNDLFRQEDWNVGYCESSMEDFINNTDKEQLNILRKQKEECF